MTNRELMQQALEALEWADNAMYEGEPIQVNTQKAINALRAALAEPDYWQEEARRYAGNADYWRNRYEALAEPVQEPVAPKCGAIIEVFGKDWRLEYMSLPVGKHKLYIQQYNYTAPPQRQPLTKEEIMRAFYAAEKTPMSIRHGLSVVEAARIVERAHGIGETK